ncbi:cRISPR-associated RAMP protein Csm5 family [Phascolarctobacterium succinatutens CAG:287]|uniref:CRISPR system Cms protein Csm5 n=2 Tax=Phascolarctobacterium succinatutens TaxID=626940 RepID=R6XWG5_9FIRM|nr:type III-A CRISPR-associated RAMP protein Csm5 [Phascolarctobacterium succinatutens]CDD10597.1 cRISPR-associated RAMP protein Csm5 family [Phascolarctobacterium succinatutens CAG:287]
MNSKQFETAKMCLKVVTPINISDGIVLGAKDYLYDSRRQKVFFLNLHQWHMFIYKHMLLEKYESYLANFRDKQSLLEWLQMQGYDIDDVRTVITSEAQATVNLMDNEKKKTLNDINRHIQQPDGSLYVPGSSIKGVFRTAILYSLLQKRQDIKSKYWCYIKQQVDIIKTLLEEERKPRELQIMPYSVIKKKKDQAAKEIDKLTASLESELLHTLRLKDDKERNISNKNAVCSAMRGLQVSDTYASRNMQTAILQKVDGGFDKFGKASPKKLPIFRECMLPKAELFFDVKIEKAVMSTIGISSVDDLLKATHSFFAAVTDLLQQAFGKEYQEAFQGVAAGNMFLGGNTGFLSKTLLAMLAPDKDTAKNTIKVLLDKSFKNHKHLLRDKIIAPRTLKCTNYNGKLMLMGVAEVRKV